MTLQDAHAQFTALAEKVTPGRTPAELAAISAALNSLMRALPNAEEFDVIGQEIADFSKKLSGQMDQAALADLQSRTAILTTANQLLTDTANRAAADARTLTFAKPTLIAATLKTSLTTVLELRDAAKTGNVQQALEKAQALQALLIQAQSTIKG